MKDQGCRQNFSLDLQPILINTKAQEAAGKTSYFYKAYEAFVMLKASSQVDENSDFKNTDVLRVQGFSQSLLYKVM